MSQGPAGGVVTKGVVSDTVETYISGDVQPLSINSEGRLRVSQVSAAVYIEFFRTDDQLSFNVPNLTNATDLWEVGDGTNPYP